MAKIAIQVPVVYFKEDNIFYASIPALEILGYGYTEKEAKASLDVMVKEFFDYTTKNKTLHSELKRMGWKKIEYPPLSNLIHQDQQLKNIFDNREVRTGRKKLNLPALANA